MIHVLRFSKSPIQLSVRRGSLWVLLPVFLCAAPARSAGIYDISLNTASLIGHIAGPFSLDFQLIDGAGTGDANNTAQLSDFSFNTGSAMGSPVLLGGASGSLSSAVTLTDSAFLNEFTQSFLPGDGLRF